MVTFISEKVTKEITRIYEISGVQMYLIEGSKRAALIDTGSGVGDLSGFIRTLTKLPITVLLTHGHVDHAMGTFQFEDVYMNFKDKEIYQAHCSMEMRKNYLSTMSPAAKFAEVTIEDYLPEASCERFHDLKDGDVFDLGGITVEAVYCPGHTPGSTFFWIHGCDVLITGDGCNYFTMLQDKFCLTVSEYEKHLMHAIERTKGKYTDIYLSHGQVIVPSSLLENVVLVCKEIEAGIDDKVPFEFMGVKGMVAKAFGSSGGSGYMRLDGGFGNIVYNPERIWQQ